MQAKCIGRAKDSKGLTIYKLIDVNGNTAIKSYEWVHKQLDDRDNGRLGSLGIDIINLKLSSDGKILEKKNTDTAYNDVLNKVLRSKLEITLGDAFNLAARLDVCYCMTDLINRKYNENLEDIIEDEFDCAYNDGQEQFNYFNELSKKSENKGLLQALLYKAIMKYRNKVVNTILYRGMTVENSERLGITIDKLDNKVVSFGNHVSFVEDKAEAIRYITGELGFISEGSDVALVRLNTSKCRVPVYGVKFGAECETLLINKDIQMGFKLVGKRQHGGKNVYFYDCYELR